jgi:hypothetical protein
VADGTVAIGVPVVPETLGSVGDAEGTPLAALFRVSVTTGAVVRAVATAETTEVAANGCVVAWLAAPVGTDVNESVTAGTRFLMTFRPGCPADCAFATGGIRGGA